MPAARTPDTRADTYDEYLPALSGLPTPTLSRTARARATGRLIEELRACGPDDHDLRELLLGRLVVVNRGVAEAVAARYRGRGVDEEDLVQAAYEGLVKAVHRFDVSLEVDLLTYAVPIIRGALQRYFRDFGWTIRPPRGIQELQWRLKNERDRLQHGSGRPPTEDELCAALGVSRDEYREAISAQGCFSPASLDQPATMDSSATLGDLVPAAGRERELCETHVLLEQAFRVLSDADRRLLHMRFYEELSQQQIADRLGHTQMQVSRMLHRVFKRMRDAVGEVEPLTSASDAA